MGDHFWCYAPYAPPCPNYTLSLMGYESGFPSADGQKKDLATLEAGVVSAEHIPVASAKVQAGKAAVLLLVGEKTVQSIRRGRLEYVPVRLIEGADEDSFEVVMEAPTLLYRTNTEAKARKEQQIATTEKRITDATATLAELQEALGRSKSAFKAAVETAADPDGDAELSDIGAMAAEQQRIKNEISKQQTALQEHYSQLAALRSTSDDDLDLVEHRITPRFSVQSGDNLMSAVEAAQDQYGYLLRDEQEEKVLQVVRRPQPAQRVAMGEVQFEYAAAAAQ